MLQRHGLDLLVGHDLWPVPGTGGTNEIDHALRREVQAVEPSSRGAGRCRGGKSREGGRTGRECCAGDPTRKRLATKAPQPDSPWTERRQAVMGYVCWLVDGCGVTRAAAARVLNSSGQRTPTAGHGSRKTCRRCSTVVTTAKQPRDQSGLPIGAIGSGQEADVLQTCYACSMSTVASRELRNDTAGVLRRVQAGEEVTITVNGRAVAVIAAVEPGGAVGVEGRIGQTTRDQPGGPRIA